MQKSFRYTLDVAKWVVEAFSQEIDTVISLCFSDTCSTSHSRQRFQLIYAPILLSDKFKANEMIRNSLFDFHSIQQAHYTICNKKSESVYSKNTMMAFENKTI